MPSFDRQQLTDRADFREFIDQLESVAVWSGSRTGLEYMSPAFEEIYGRPIEDVMEDMAVIVESTHPDDREAIVNLLAGADERIRNEDSVREEHRIVRPGGEIRWVEARIFPLESAPGEDPDAVGVTIDITDRKRAELELERQNERLERFANVLSHDLRGPLTSARGYLELVTDEFSHRYLDAVGQALTRIEEIISDVLTLSRIGKMAETSESVDLAETARGAWQITDEDHGHLAGMDDLGTIEASRSLVGQLFENAFRNAVEHGSTSHAEPDGSEDALEHGSQDVTVQVGLLEEKNGFYIADDGEGIPEAEHEEAFEAGYSTSDTGSGFGLLIIREIVDVHGWDVRITVSETGGVRLEVSNVNVGPVD
ncbi:putative light and redox sensing histidine kinase [Halovivax asiaticus JCM 14624]|uniref:histidine kinase n=1 Tax=Halovivax asiaticus JCM 14624 TaxID=1227490 RepID=M0BCW7_9EURY|nr:HAMP domain-containing sensor histidine kinase [Halovivax asiaticus]ELZ08317.1 putative light and redox sensing histidine kinase [Halovivax asiaticus JCM 14624]